MKEKLYYWTRGLFWAFIGLWLILAITNAMYETAMPIYAMYSLLWIAQFPLCITHLAKLNHSRALPTISLCISSFALGMAYGGL
jgi:hypothetical protein